MKYRTLGRTGLQVSELGFGTWAFGDNPQAGAPGPVEESQAIEAVRVALELGCNFFDTADIYGYGQSEQLLARGLREAAQLDKVIIATKGGGNFSSGQTVMDFSPRYIEQAVEASLRRLGRDYVDIYQLHNPSRQIIADGAIFELLDNLKRAGKIRFYGVSVHSVAEGMACIKSGKPDTIQIVYNISSLLQSENPAEQLFPQAHDRNIGLIAREPLANGFLTGKQKLDATYSPGDIRASWPQHYRAVKIGLAESLRFLEKPGRTLTQAAVRFTLDEPSLSTVIVGMKTAQQVRENLAVTELPSLTGEEQQRVHKTLFG